MFSRKIRPIAIQSIASVFVNGSTLHSIISASVHINRIRDHTRFNFTVIAGVKQCLAVIYSELYIISLRVRNVINSCRQFVILDFNGRCRRLLGKIWRTNIVRLAYIIPLPIINLGFVDLMLFSNWSNFDLDFRGITRRTVYVVFLCSRTTWTAGSGIPYSIAGGVIPIHFVMIQGIGRFCGRRATTRFSQILKINATINILIFAVFTSTKKRAALINALNFPRTTLYIRRHFNTVAVLRTTRFDGYPITGFNHTGGTGGLTRRRIKIPRSNINIVAIFLQINLKI